MQQKINYDYKGYKVLMVVVQGQQFRVEWDTRFTCRFPQVRRSTCGNQSRHLHRQAALCQRALFGKETWLEYKEERIESFESIGYTCCNAPEETTMMTVMVMVMVMMKMKMMIMMTTSRIVQVSENEMRNCIATWMTVEVGKLMTVRDLE
jgi:hypothetical protein